MSFLHGFKNTKASMDLEQNIPTSLAILELVEDNTDTIDDCKSTVGVFIDLKKRKRPLTQWIIIILSK